MTQQQPFCGKYRGVVSDNRDPLMLGRVRAKVQDIFGDRESGWAMPCVPYAGDGVGLYLIPPAGSSVWIEFEQGNPERPIWSGCFWATGELPAQPAMAEMKVLKTETATITLNDTPGLSGITLELDGGGKISLSSLGIEISAGQGTVTINGSQVSLNNGVLEVT
jgi:uncharacterized protein involved in type VI secretion and phage assembly